MSCIAAVCPALPAHRHRQADLAAATAELCALPEKRRGLLERLYANAGVQTRHTVLPLADYKRLDGLGPANDVYIEHAVELGSQAVAGALAQAGIQPQDVDLFVATSVTGVAVPSLDARLVPLLGMRPDVKRVPMFGLGCVAGAAGLARIHDYLRAWPEHTAVLLAVELCSLSVPLAEPSPADLVGSALFGDGACAVVVRGSACRDGDRHAGRPRIIATRSELCPGTQDVLGWRLGTNGFRIVLSAALADVLAQELGGVVERFLADHGLRTSDVGTWVVHPGGPKVIDAVRDALDLTEDRVTTARDSLAEVGNLSSASVLHVLAKALAEPAGSAKRAGAAEQAGVAEQTAGPPVGTGPAGAAGPAGIAEPSSAPGPLVMVGLGPGVSIELLLLERSG